MIVENILEGLNPQQAEAVQTTEGPLLVLAGAGSGKTSVLTRRIAWILKQGLASRGRILALTFTNKAAREMGERIEALCGDGFFPHLGTFHSVCSRWLRREAEALGLSAQFTVYDTAAQLAVMKAVLKEMNLDEKRYPPRNFLAAVSRCKNYGISVNSLAASDKLEERNLARIYELYDKKLHANAALDFDDILVYAVRMLTEHPDLKEAYCRRFRYILVDEYQDVNPVQYELLRILSSQHRCLCAVGDDDQSIYGFRGADISIILRFEDDFSEAKVIKLEQNYRSTQGILNAANALVRHNQGRKGKNLWSAKQDSSKPYVYGAATAQSEARFVANQIERLNCSGEYTFGDVAILYRNNSLSRLLEAALVERGIPYELVGGNKFYDRKEIKDVLSYLHLLVNPEDSVSVGRVVSTMPGVGDTSLQKIASYASMYRLPIIDALTRAKEAGVRPNIAKILEGFYQWLVNLRLRMGQMRVKVADLVQEVLDFTHYRERLREQNNEEADSRLANLDELVSVVTEFDAKHKEEDFPLESFMAEVSLLSDQDSIVSDTERVTLMTIHTSKGLEFPVVFLTGLEEEVLPSHRSLNDANNPDAVEEERRLAYVGITRAKERLFMSYASSRMVGERFSDHMPSRFLEEIPRELLEVNDSNAQRYSRGGSTYSGFMGRGGRRGEGGSVTGRGGWASAHNRDRWSDEGDVYSWERGEGRRENPDFGEEQSEGGFFSYESAQQARGEEALRAHLATKRGAGTSARPVTPVRERWHQIAEKFPAGSSVGHKTYGIGKVVSVVRDKVKVRFPSGVERDIMQDYLEPVSQEAGLTCDPPKIKLAKKVEIGSKVMHSRFGVGIVRGIDGQMASVKFPSVKTNVPIKDLQPM